MVTAPLLTVGVPINLPKTKAKALPEDQAPLSITINKEEKIFVQDTEISIEKLIPKLIYNILNNKPLPIYGKGTNSREWIYVKDHCEALYTVFKKGKIGETYNIGASNQKRNL